MHTYFQHRSDDDKLLIIEIKLTKSTLFHQQICQIIDAYWLNIATCVKTIKGVLHLLPKLNMFCALSLNNQHLHK